MRASLRLLHGQKKKERADTLLLPPQKLVTICCPTPLRSTPTEDCAITPAVSAICWAALLTAGALSVATEIPLGEKLFPNTKKP